MKTLSGSEQLKNVDRLMKLEKFDDALQIVETILISEPRNIYARAYHERITALIAERLEVKNINPVEEVTAVESVKPITFSNHKISSAIREAYATLLHEIWKDGIVTTNEQTQIDEMRISFGISNEEHTYLDRIAKTGAFLRLIKQEWKKGKRIFQDIEEQFHFSQEDQQFVLPKLSELMQSLKSHATILVLDDDTNFLLFTKKILEKAQFHCLTSETAEEGLELLEIMEPDVVLCDIAFGKNLMNGFTFYERFRSIKKFDEIPFIFVTALIQESIMLMGKKLGADDYITKPFNQAALLATIEGKLRRFHDLTKLK
jgi:CheY-like chemotaxis protein